MKLILLNGPKGVGKDETAAQYVTKNASTPLAMILSIMRPSKVAALREFGMTTHDVAYFETVKDIVRHDLGMKTPRQVYIEYGERVRAENPNAVVELWLEDAKEAVRHGIEFLIVPDCRFPQELIAAVELVGVDNVCLVNVYRPGHDWTDDIGSYLGYDRMGAGGLEQLNYELHNTGPVEKLGEALALIVELWEAGATSVERHTGVL